MQETRLPNRRYYTNSELSTARRCLRRWWLTYYRRLTAVLETFHEARAIGTMVHDAVAGFYETDLDVVQIIKGHELALADKYQDELSSADTPDLERELVSAVSYALAIATGYVEWLEETGADQGLQLLDVEAEREAPLYQNDGSPFLSSTGKHITLLGKLDARWYDESQDWTFFMDHKVVPDLTRFPKWAHLSTQILFYHLIELLTDGATHGGVYNLLRKSKRTTRAKPPFYKRHPVHVNEMQLQNFWTTTWAQIQALELKSADLDAGVDHRVVCPPAPDESCAWQCPFFSVCGMLDDGSDAEGYLNEFFVEGDPLARYLEIEKR